MYWTDVIRMRIWYVYIFLDNDIWYILTITEQVPPQNA